ncbi:TRAP transporter small permease subunit [Chloroflexota bacterium]
MLSRGERGIEKQIVARIVKRVANIGGYCAGWLVLAMMGTIFVEVFMRYVLNRPLGVGDEFAAYMLVALAYFGAAYTWMGKGHVRVTALVTRLPPKVASWLRLVTLACVFFFVLALCEASYGFMHTSFKLGLRSATWLRVPLQVPHATVVVGFLIFLLALGVDIARAIMNIRAGKSVEET